MEALTREIDKSPQVCLVVLDGWGYREPGDDLDNAVAQANTPAFDSLWLDNPHTLLNASGRAVGLPDGQMGNSEVGHTTIGAGYAVETDLVRIGDAVDRNEFAGNEAFKSLFEHVTDNDSTLHVLGLIGDGGIHAHSDHMFALLTAARDSGVKQIVIHAFTDGRDTAPQSGARYLEQLEEHISRLGVGFIGSISGRFYAMDRDDNLDRQARAEQALFDGQGQDGGRERPSELLARLYGQNIVDEQLEPYVFKDEHHRTHPIEPNDAVVFMNFRSDRAEQLSRAINQRSGIKLATLTSYGDDIEAGVAFPLIDIPTTLAHEISLAGLSQAHIAESEKGPHATYFLNGKRRTPHHLETPIIVPSFNSKQDSIDTHDQAPDMRAEPVATATIEQLEGGADFVFVNFANPDMVGHTGNVPKIIRALETADTQLRRVAHCAVEHGVVLLVTADHGNAELNKHPDGTPHTAHTTNPVPFIVANGRPEISLAEEGGLADIAPTVLNLLNISPPANMTGRNLITG